MLKLVEKENKIYHQLFGHIPNTIIGRIAYILGKRATSKNARDSIEKEVRRIKRIKWKSISFTMFKIFKPSARPRANTRMGFVRMYVPRAKENGEWAIDYLNKHPMKKITTPCKFKISFYEKTPSSFSLRDKVLAEMGYLRPWKRTGDVDNFQKTILDMLQIGGLLEDDCLVIHVDAGLYYSIKPRCEVTIEYMEKFPN